MSTVTLTIPQYADQLRKDKQNRHSVFKAVKKNKLHLLPGVIKITKIGRYTLLEVVT